jgi:hypothetical protein|tara:strand:+ start:236 stop:910 length:675 start_codon:yes stop_codon:yes gene_type:complete
MGTSGTYDFSMDIDEVIQEATEMIGGEQTLGHEPKSARRSINLLLQDWQNRGILLWTAGTTAISVSTSVTSYALTSSTIDVTEAVLRRDNIDLQLERITMEEYLKIPRKSQTGRPNQYAIRRERGNPVLFLWPVPDNTTDILKLEQVKHTEDVTKSAGQNADISRRFLPCLTTGLAYYMAMKRPGVDVGRIGLLKAEYEERLMHAMDEDRERASAYFLPRINRL